MAFWVAEAQNNISKTKGLRRYFIFGKLGLVRVLDADPETIIINPDLKLLL